jgi:tol-pal system protein YbgF
MMFLRPHVLSLAVVVVLALPGAAFAQRKDVAPAQPMATAEGLSEVQVRTLRLEQMVEQLTGQIEELRFQNNQMSRQLQQIQDDLSLRVARIEQTMNGGVAPAESAAVEAPRAAIPSSVSPTGAAMTAKDKNVVDFNAPASSPVSRQPDMAPRAAAPANAANAAMAAAPAVGAATDNGFVIRTDAGGKVLPPDPNAPKSPPPAAPMTPAPAPKAAPGPGPVAAANLNTNVAVALPAGTPKQQYDYAFDFLKRQDYPRAEAALREFIKRNAKDPLAGNAQYWLGESLYVRGDYQTAAVEFMAGYQNYPKSNKGPDNLLKLGMAMSHLNQTPGACTALGRIAKEYPDAPEQIRTTAKAERTKLKCT